MSRLVVRFSLGCVVGHELLSRWGLLSRSRVIDVRELVALDD